VCVFVRVKRTQRQSIIFVFVPYTFRYKWKMRLAWMKMLCVSILQDS